MRIVVATRGSDLALAQSGEAAERLRRLGHEVELAVVRTAGDAAPDRAFAEVGVAGVFVREIEHALLDRRADMAVHSYKDLPSASPGGLVVAAVPSREDPADAIVARPETIDAERGLLPLREGARVGTASARRASLVRHFRPDLRVELLRGNVPTRLAKLREGRHDAILLAAAGLRRLAGGHGGRAPADPTAGLVVARLDPERFVPAPAQGALAYQARRDDEALRGVLQGLDDASARRPVVAERDLLARVQGGCEVPFGAWCRLEGGALEMVAFIERAGRAVFARGRGEDPSALARDLWDRLSAGGEAADDEARR